MKIQSKIRLSKILALQLAIVFATVSAKAQSRGFQMGTWGPSTAELQQQIHTLKGIGADIVRFPIYFSYDSSVNSWLGKTIACAGTARSLGMTVVVTFHHPTPGKVGSYIDDEADFRNRWKRFASGLKGYGNVWMNLANEPRSSYNGRSWRDIAQTVGRDILAIDPSKKIVVACPGTTLRQLDNFNPPVLNNLIVECHAYDWSTEQGSTFAIYPNSSSAWNRTGIRERLDKAVRFRSQYGVPVYIGETAVRSIDDAGNQNPYSATFIADFTQECRNRNLPLTLHAFREFYGWDYERNSATWAAILRWLRNSP